MAASVIAAQMYTLREFCKTPADITASLKKVKKIGYDAVQLSGLGKIDAKELAGILKGEGLTVAATHDSFDRMKNHPQEVIAELRLWGCKYTALGGFFEQTTSASDWVDFANSFNPVAKKLAAAGIKVGYHNHSHELAHYGGKPALQILLDYFNQDVWMEIDTYWIAHGGGDPAAWINKVAGRIPCIHFKDLVISAKREQQMAEVGEGNLNWAAILEACRAAKVEWYIVEQDTCQRDPFESLAISLKNLKSWGLS